MARPQKRNSGDCKILSVVWYKVLPARYGGQKAVALFNDALAEQLPLICICSKNNEVGTKCNYKVINILPTSKTQFINPFTWWKILRFAKSNQVTHVLLEFPYYGIAAFLCKKVLHLKTIINTHNIEFLRFKMMKKWWWRFLYYFEKWALLHADLVFFKTKQDLDQAQLEFGLRKEKLLVVPYGISKKNMLQKGVAAGLIRQRHQITNAEVILLFAGTLDYEPNAQAVKSIAEKIIPILLSQNFSFRVIVCGRNKYPSYQHLQHCQSEHLLFAGDVDDIENYFLAANVFINPVLTGGGIQTKSLEALSYHLNVVCFESKSLSIQDVGTKLFAVRDEDYYGFAQRIVLAAGIECPTPSVFFDTYNWHTISANASAKISSL